MPLVAMLVTLIGSSVCGIAVSHVGRLVPQRQRAWMKAIQKRVGFTSDVIGQIKSIKISGLTEAVAERMQRLRRSEIRHQKAFRRLQVGIITLGALHITDTRMAPDC